jgi:hypothetical protein
MSLKIFPYCETGAVPLPSPLSESPPLWSSGQSSWLQIQSFGFDSRRDQIFWEVMGLERSPLSLVSTIEELLGRKSCGSGLENRDYCRRDPSRWPHGTFYRQKLSLTLLTSGNRSVGIICSRTPASEFSLVFLVLTVTHDVIQPVSDSLLFCYDLLTNS